MGLKSRTFRYWIRCYCYNNNYILWIKRNCKGFVGNIILIVSIPYILLCSIFSILYEEIYGKRRINKLMTEEQSRNFLHEIAIVAIAKNEGAYVKEWIEYHRLVGINKFYFYDNESNDDTFEVLMPYIESKIVEYVFISGKSKQLDAYDDAIRKHKDECRWMAFIDLDEYLFPMQPLKPIHEIVNRLVLKAGKGAAGIGVNWAIFGSSYYTNTPEGLITKNFIRRGENTHWLNYHIKTICNPRLVKKYISPHYPLYKLGAYSISESEGKRIYGWFCWSVRYSYIRINHYFTKSKEQFLAKRNRGLADRLGQYELEKFDIYDLNDIIDKSMEIYVKKMTEK